MKTKITLCVIASSLIFFDGCKKYEDGPMLSFRSKKARVEGNWKVDKYTVDGIDVLNHSDNLSYYSSMCSATFNYVETQTANFTMNLTKDGGLSFSINLKFKTMDQYATDNSCSLIYQDNSDAISEAGTWSFLDKKTKIQFYMGGDISIYDILELKEKEMKIKGTNSGSVEELLLKQ